MFKNMELLQWIKHLLGNIIDSTHLLIIEAEQSVGGEISKRRYGIVSDIHFVHFEIDGDEWWCSEYLIESFPKISYNVLGIESA